MNCVLHATQLHSLRDKKNINNIYLKRLKSSTKMKYTKYKHVFVWKLRFVL